MGEFDFDIEHIRGVDNVAADGFSCLCPVMIDRQIVTGVEGDGIPQRVDGNDDLHHPRDSSTREVSDSLMLLDEVGILPDSKYDDIASVHNSLAGHHGLEKTLRKLVLAGKRWKYMREDVRTFLAQFLDMAGTEHNCTIAYSKEENVDHRSWPDYLPMAQRIVNATVHSSIGMSPYQLL